MKLDYRQVIAKLEALGMKFSHVSVSVEGNYTAEDGIWNYKDAMAHIPHIHPLVRNVPILNHQDSLASVFIQKIFFFKVPMVVYDYEATPLTQTAVTSLCPFVLVIHNICEDLGVNRSRTTTHYHIGAGKLFAWLAPIVGWVLKRNYKALTETDVPLRKRRGELRSWGYRFVTSDYLNAENLAQRNVLEPLDLAVPAPAEVNLVAMAEGENFLWGKSDVFGVRLLRKGNTVFAYSRICLHQGASLDSASCRGKSLACPWHGLSIKPLAQINLRSETGLDFLGEYHRFLYSDGILSILPHHSRRKTQVLQDSALRKTKSEFVSQPLEC